MVSKAMKLTGGDETAETVQFVSLFDQFFNCLNDANFTAGQHNWMVFQQPYRSGHDFCLQVHIYLEYKQHVTVQVHRHIPYL